MAESENPKTDGAAAEGGGGKTPPRRAGLRNFFAAMKHIYDASGAESVSQRTSDYVTIALVVVCIIALVAAVALPLPPEVPPSLKLLPLALTVFAVIFYIVNRLGIVLSLSQRQALIIWQIIIAAFWLGVTSSMLVMMLSVWYFGQIHG